jgi:hypothetical protein
MQRVPVKTFALLLALLVVVIAHQHLGCVSSARAGVSLLADDPNDPNAPRPESCLPGNYWTQLQVLSDANEPNEPAEPEPESA